MKLRSLAARTALAGLLLPFAAVFAAEAPHSTHTVIVTGGIAPRTPGSEIAATTVLTRDDIERAGARDLVSALELVGTAQVEQLGGPGTAAVVRLRGADSRDTLVLVDGVPITDVTTGQATLAQIPAELIERIEVVRGNLSALYGANATGGVIQVFTRRGMGGFDARASIGAGSRRTQSAAASVGAGAAALRGRLSVGGERSDGFSAAAPSIAPSANPDRDGYRRRHAALALDADPAPGHSIGLDFRVLRGDVDYDSTASFSAPADTHHQYTLQRTAALRGRHRVGEGWSLDWRASDADEVRRDDTTSGFGPFSFGNTLHNRAGALEVNGTPAAGWRLQLGAERLTQSTDAPSYTRDERRTDVIRGGVQVDAAWGSAQANLRRDRTSDFGSATTALAGTRFALGDAFSVNASASSSFTPPTLDFLFFDCTPFVCSNPALRPERSRNVDLGVQWEAGATLVRATLFAARYRDKIVNDANFVPQNVERASNRGVELAARSALGAWRLAGEATLHDPHDDATGERLPRRARGQLALRADYDRGAWGAGAALRHVGARRDVGGEALPAATLVDASARWSIAPSWTLRGTIENVFDRDHQPAFGYRGKPRGVFVSLSGHTR